MARLARVVAPGYPHHVTQRGNRRMQTFFGEDDLLVKVAPMLEIVGRRMPDWQAYLALETPAETIRRLRLHERTGRPLGEAGFVAKLERLLGRPLARRKPGPKPKKHKK